MIAPESAMQLRCLMCYSVFTTPTWRLRCPECVLTCAETAESEITLADVLLAAKKAEDGGDLSDREWRALRALARAVSNEL